MDLFEEAGNFQSFIKLLEVGRQRCSMRILGYCLMDNHWRLIREPRQGADLSRFMGWVCTTHARRWREQRGNKRDACATLWSNAIARARCRRGGSPGWPHVRISTMIRPSPQEV